MKRSDRKHSSGDARPQHHGSAPSDRRRRGAPLGTHPRSLDEFEPADLRKLALSDGVQALWQAVLPLIGVGPAEPGEFAGEFRVEAGPAQGEATIYLDIPQRAYEDSGKHRPLERVLALTVRLEHDYRRLGDAYYCVDCEPEPDETRH